MSVHTLRLAAFAGLALLFVPATSEAQNRGGGGRSGGGNSHPYQGGNSHPYQGGNSGNYHGGNGNVRSGISIGIGGYGLPYQGGYGGNYYGGYGYPHSGINIGIGSPYHAGYYNNGSYNHNGYYQNSYYDNGYYNAAPSVVVTQPGGVIQSGYQSFYPPTGEASGIVPAPSNDNTASIVVMVPANAELWWNGSAVSGVGDMRRFRTSSVGADGGTQQFQARWRGADGQVVTQTREVRVSANGTFTVDFNQAAPNAPMPAKSKK